MPSGIYKIINKKNNKLYIGSGKNLNDRKRSHFTSLKQNSHNNQHLQNAWNKYGQNAFKFKTIEKVDDTFKRWKREQEYLDSYRLSGNWNKLYNIQKAVNNHFLAEETKQKMSKSSKGENNSFYGKTHTKETREKISKTKNGTTLSKEHKEKFINAPKKLSDKDVVEIRGRWFLENIPRKILSNEYGVKENTISTVTNGYTFKHIKFAPIKGKHY